MRVRVDGTVYELDQVPELAPRKNHTIEAIVDRLIMRDNIRPRLAESLQLALKHGNGVLTILSALPVAAPPGAAAGAPLPPSDWHEELFSTLHACPSCRISFEELEPRTFSFNSPYGACPACEGLGSRERVRSRSRHARSFACRSATARSRRGAMPRPDDVERRRSELAAFLTEHEHRAGTRRSRS